MKLLNQSWSTLSGLQLSGALSLPVIMIGYYLGQHYSSLTGFSQIILGNIGLFSLALFYLRTIHHRKGLTIELAETLFGKSGTFICAAGLVLSLMGWSAIQLHLLAAATHQPVVTVLLAASSIYYLTSKDLSFLGRLNVIILPFLVASLSYLLFSLPEQKALPVFLGNESFKRGLVLVMIAGSGLVFDLPTFFRHAATAKDALISIVLLFLIALPLIEGLGIYLALHKLNQASWINSLIQSFSLPTLSFLLLSGLFSSCLNLYSATMTITRLFGLSYSKVLLALSCTSALFALINLEQHFSPFLEMMNLNAEIITLMILIYVGFEGKRMPEPASAQKRWYQTIFIIVLTYAGGAQLLKFSLFNDLFVDLAFLSCLMMGSYCALLGLQKRLKHSREIPKLNDRQQASPETLLTRKDCCDAVSQLNKDNLATLSLGATLLGSGGGGDPSILYGPLHYLLNKNGPVKIIQQDNLPQDALVVPLALIGAPLISLERLPNSIMFLELLNAIRKNNPGRKLVLMPAEIGGCNALTPFMLAAQTGLAVLDADLIGRAFPKLQMCKPAVLGKHQQITYLASPFGNCTSFETSCLNNLETKAREITIQYGSSAVIATFLFEAKEHSDYLIPDSLTRALQLGHLLQNASRDRAHFAELTQARKIGEGILTEICHSLEDGFLTGYALIKMATQTIQVFYQNEYLLVQEEHQEKILAASPELITLLESRSGQPLTSESLRYGLRVEVFALPAPDFWNEPRAYAEVNIDVFGLRYTQRGQAYV